VNGADFTRFVHTYENYRAIQRQLSSLHLVAFVANGSILPRESGASSRPLRNAVPFQSPESLQVDVTIPHALPESAGGGTTLSGMGIREGITLIAGGGYHGKSTLLQALQAGVYPHVPGDGREYVVTVSDAVKVRAEDGRSICGVDISGFMQELPGGILTDSFSTTNASGSTSQAAGIIEALESGATTLLIDEDTSATNFMIRDGRMQRLVEDKHEPIIPFLDRIEELYQQQGVSTVLVMGGCGDYLDVADAVVVMKDYVPFDRTADAKVICQEVKTLRSELTREPFVVPSGRTVQSRSIDASRGRRSESVKVRDRFHLGFGGDELLLSALEQLVDSSQTRAIGKALLALRHSGGGGPLKVQEALEELSQRLLKEGPDFLGNGRGKHPGNLVVPRRHEVLAALGRLRSLRPNKS
jgi:predicted ABC-class ATPase